MPSDSSLLGFIQSLPKTETHLHIEGALPYELLRAWQPDRYPEFPEFRERGYRYASFEDFNRILLENALPWFTSAERYHDAAKVVFARHVTENIKYVETSFHLPVSGFIGVPAREIVAAIKAAAPAGLAVRVFAGMLRSDISGTLRPVIDELHSWPELDGVDLHGVESLTTEPDTAAIWARLRAAGKATKCHAGEFGGPAKVREAIELLGVTRIQHGIRAGEDPALLKLAGDRDVTFDVCPISNVGLQVVPDMAHHPLRRLGEAGVRCTLSTDDPLCFANTVNEEYVAVAQGLDFTRQELARLARNGFEVALLPAAQKQVWLDQLDVILKG